MTHAEVLDAEPGSSGDINAASRSRATPAPRITALRASTAELMEIVGRIRHAAYVDQGYLKPIPGGVFLDEDDAKPNFTSYLIMVDGEPAGSARLSFYDPSGRVAGADSTPAQHDFGAEIDALASELRPDGQPPSMLETTRLVRLPRFSRSSDVVFGLYRLNFYHIVHLDPDMLLSSVRARHASFYRRMGFVKITDPRPYHCLDFEAGLMACPRSSYAPVQARTPFFRNIAKGDEFYRRFFGGEVTPLVFPSASIEDAPRAALAMAR